MNKRIFESTLSSDGIREIESITHYTEHRISFWSRIVDYFGYAIGVAIVATPFVFGVVANVSGVI